MNAKEISSKIRQILQDYHRRDDYSLEDAEKDVLNLIQVSAVMPTITDEEIEAHFTTPHYHYEKGHYYKVRKDRIFGAKWMRDEIRKRIGRSTDSADTLGLAVYGTRPQKQAFRMQVW